MKKRKKIPLMSFVVPKESSLNPNNNWSIGKVISMERFDLSIGPILTILDIISGKRFKTLPGSVDRIVRAK